ncbi:MAG: general stress protein [Dehalococcoidia bacterium]
MTTTGRRTDYQNVIVQIYDNTQDAENAVRELMAAGFTTDDVSVVAQDAETAEEVGRESGAGEDVAKGAGIGAVTGGVLGTIAGLLVGGTALTITGIGLVVAGPLAAVLAGAGTGAVTGGLAGALAGLGISESDAEHYENRLKEGDILVLVAAGARQPEARRILLDEKDGR